VAARHGRQSTRLQPDQGVAYFACNNAMALDTTASRVRRSVTPVSIGTRPRRRKHPTLRMSPRTWKRRRRTELALRRLADPCVQQIGIHVMPARDRRNRICRMCRLLNDPQLLFASPRSRIAARFPDRRKIGQARLHLGTPISLIKSAARTILEDSAHQNYRGHYPMQNPQSRRGRSDAYDHIRPNHIGCAPRNARRRDRDRPSSIPNPPRRRC
jgi:uncharacterized protein YjiS (DUF1127 family)